MSFSEYIVYVDESGDHGLQTVNPDYLTFVLAFCVFKKVDYINSVVPEFQKLKFECWGHDAVVLHEHDIRKSRDGDFRCLSDPEFRSQFLQRLNGIIGTVPFHIIATVVMKDRLVSKYSQPANPYELSLLFCMEALHSWLEQEGEQGKTISLIFECRGHNEDRDLELEFRRICDNRPQCLATETNFSTVRYDLRFVAKKANCTGLQLADLVARPIGLHMLKPTQQNRAFDILKTKIKYLKQFP